jgi:hypothetical protein
MNGKLSTLVRLKEYLSISDAESDALLSRLLQAASQFVVQYCSRGFTVERYQDQFFGNGKTRMLLNNFPVVSVESVTGITGSATPPASGNPLANGYALLYNNGSAPATLQLFGMHYPTDRLISVDYTAGYQYSQFMTVPSPVAPATAPTLEPMGRAWVDDIKVEAEGTLWTRVDSDPQPTEYAVDEEGVYTFNSADIGTGVDITYSYVPYDVEQAVLELTGSTFKRRDRLDINSKTLGGQETVVFSRASMTETVRSMLRPYINVVPQ